MKLHELLTTKHIQLDFTASGRENVIEQLVNILHTAGEIDNPKAVLEMVINRERMVGTGIGYGIAIPHAEPGPFPRAMAAMVRLKEGVDFGAPDNLNARLVFILLTPETTPALHVRLLARICRLTRSETLRERLLTASSPEEVVSIISSAEADYPDLTL